MFPSRYVRMALKNHGNSERFNKIKISPLRHLLVAAGGMGWYLTHLKYFISPGEYFPNFEILVTRSCPFNCKCCIHFLPEYKEQNYESAESVIADMTVLLSSVKLIDEVRISGGDAFTYPELDTLVKFLMSQKKIGRISVVASGAVSPDERITALLSNPKVRVDVDDYGKDSDKVGEFRALSSSNVHIHPYNTWMDYGDESCRSRSSAALDRQYSACNSERFCLQNGRIYACPRSAHGENLGFFENGSAEYVDLRSTSDPKEITAKIGKLRRISHLTACNHCNCCTEAYKEYSQNCRFKNS